MRRALLILAIAFPLLHSASCSQDPLDIQFNMEMTAENESLLGETITVQDARRIYSVAQLHEEDSAYLHSRTIRQLIEEGKEFDNTIGDPTKHELRPRIMEMRYGETSLDDIVDCLADQITMHDHQSLGGVIREYHDSNDTATLNALTVRELLDIAAARSKSNQKTPEDRHEKE